MASTSPSKTLVSYYALACGISWLLWVPLYLGPDGLGLIRTNLPDSFSIFSGKISLSTWLVAGSFGPTAAALIAQRISTGNFTGFCLWTSLLPVARGLAVGMFCILIARWPLAAIGMTQSGFGQWNWAALLQIRHYFLPSIPSGPLGEELGWRGFALPILQTRCGPLRGSLLLGLAWSAWHLPLFLVHGWTSAPFWVFAILLTSLSVMMTLGHNLSGGSVLVAILLHTTFNASGGRLQAFLGNASVRPHDDLIVAAAFLVSAATLVLLTRGRLGLKSGAA